jgi:acyl-CoA reductase-like NAD-dependent aldehyde dehydrogenase
MVLFSFSSSTARRRAGLTTGTDHGLAVAGRVRTGTCRVNQGYTMDPFAPFGGAKASGDGREPGAEGLDGYSVPKSISMAPPLRPLAGR